MLVIFKGTDTSSVQRVTVEVNDQPDEPPVWEVAIPTITVEEDSDAQVSLKILE